MTYKAIIYSENPSYKLTVDYGTTDPNFTVGQQNIQIGNIVEYFEVRSILINGVLKTYYLMPIK